jgi:DNA-binding transcriptional ArsR family regulator
MSKRRDAGVARRAPASSAPVFAALGDETRLQLVRRLSSGGPQSIARLAAGSPVTRQAVTKHLQVLARAGLVRGSRRGRERVWRLEPDRLEEARRWLDALSAQWDAALERLRAAVEEPAERGTRRSP